MTTKINGAEQQGVSDYEFFLVHIVITLLCSELEAPVLGEE